MNNLLSNLRLALAGAAIVTTFLPTSASGAPFTLALSTSFDCASANPVPGAGSLNCNPLLPQHLEWVQGLNPVSSLDLVDTVQNGVNAGGPPVVIGTLTHTNIEIPTTFSYSINIVSTFAVTDEADSSVDNFPPQAIGITFTESLNQTPCNPPNPEGSVCDDFFTFDVSGLAPIAFIDSEGLQKVVIFGLLAGPGTTILGNQVFTAEDSTSTLSITAQILAVDTPATLLLFGFGLVLLGLGVQHRRQRL